MYTCEVVTVTSTDDCKLAQLSSLQARIGPPQEPSYTAIFESIDVSPHVAIVNVPFAVAVQLNQTSSLIWLCPAALHKGSAAPSVVAAVQSNGKLPVPAIACALAHESAP